VKIRELIALKINFSQLKRNWCNMMWRAVTHRLQLDSKRSLITSFKRAHLI